MKAYLKAINSDKNYNPYKSTYDSMPSYVVAKKDIKQLYVDGHFCYDYKSDIVTNASGIARLLDLYNEDF